MAEPAKSRVLKSKTAVIFIVAIAAILAWPTARFLFRRTPQNTVEFSRDIRPILNQNCIACHGGVRQKNGVSFIFREEAVGNRQIRTAHHCAGRSRCVRVDGPCHFQDPETRMPYHGPPLRHSRSPCFANGSSRGAKWEDYWAFVAAQAAAVAASQASRLGAPTAGPIYSGAAGEGRSAAGSGSRQSGVVAPCLVRSDRTAAHRRRKKRRIWLIRRRTPMKSKWIVCWLRRATANAGPPCGWTWRVTPTPRVTKKIAERPGRVALSRLGDRRL